MKISKYNTYLKFYENDEEKYIIYNSLSNGMGLVNKNVYEALCNNEYKKISKLDILNNLIDGQFIYDKDIDELELLENNFNMEKYKNKIMAITVLTTFNCNFRCPYCYETLNPKEDNKPMDKNIQKYIIEYIYNYINKNEIDILKVMWSGGEPLLELNTIINLAENINLLAKEKNISVEHNMISNGYLLNEDTAIKLKKIGIKSVQITIDGSKDIHDKRRTLKDGTGTFDKLINNIEVSRKYFKIILRTNVDKYNVKFLDEYIDFLSKSNFKDDIFVYFSATSPYVASGCIDTGSCFNNKEFSDILIKLYYLAMKKGLNVSYYPTYTTLPCYAVSTNSIVIQPDGDLQKCWNTVGNTKYSLGNIKDIKNIDLRAEKWLNFSPYKIEECIKCDQLPLCQGGCAYEYLENKKCKPGCREFKYNLKDILLFNYYKSKLQK